MKSDIKNLLKKSDKIHGWGRFLLTTIMLCVEGDNSNEFILKLQKNIFKEEKVSISITSTSIKNYKKFYFIENNIVNTINESEYITYFSDLIITADKHFKVIANEFTRSVKTNPEIYIDKKLSRIFKILPSKYIPENLLIKKDFNSNYLPFLPSFSAQLTEYSIFRDFFSHQKKYNIEDIINDKVKAINFAHSLNIPVPKIYQNDIEKHEINFELKNIVLKPTYGHTSINVYIINDNSIHSVEKREKIDLETLKKEVKDSPYKNWMVEQYIPGYKNKTIPYDIKLFCFYGVVELILIIDRNDEKLRHEWLNGDFKPVNTGRFNDSLFTSNFKNSVVVDFAKKLSLNTPTPFLRIDFLASENEIYFGEITPRPGHFHEFNIETDSKLGNSFIAARARLIIDLLEGKTFDMYKKLIPQTK